jgi:hypothetical protein
VPCGIIPTNRIELNTFENNKKAGVLVLDSPPDQAPSGEANHNLGNMISCNAISGSAVLIDRKGDDLPPRPPVIERVTEGSPVTVTGFTNPPLAGASVEVFAVTRLRVDSGIPVMDAVVCSGFGTTDEDGRFTITLRSPSPTCAYAATVTDSNATTSELGFSCECPSRAVADKLSLKLKASSASGNVGGPFSSERFEIENNGCDRVIHVSSFSFLESLSADDEDERNLFFITVGDSKTPLERDQTIAINPKSSITLNLFFRSLIPRPAPCRTPDSGALPRFLPHKATTNLVIRQDGADNQPLVLSVSSKVGKAVQLINPDCGEPILPPQIEFSKSGDDFFVTFGVFDSDRKVILVTYEFMDQGGNRVGNIIEDDITSAIEGLSRGESFNARQRFSGASDNKEVTQVKVTVSDRSSKATASANLDSSQGGKSSNHLVGKASASMIILPTIRILPKSDKRFRHSATVRRITSRRGTVIVNLSGRGRWR